MKKKPKESSKKKEKVKTDPDFAILAQRIKETRIALGYSSAEKFAYDKNLPRRVQEKMESGESFTMKTFLKFCKAVGKTAEEVLKGLKIPTT